MSAAPGVLPAELSVSPVRVVVGAGTISRVGDLAREAGARERVLLVTDHAIRAAGHVSRATNALAAAFLHVVLFDDVIPNPTTETVNAGLAVARRESIDLIVGLGGGSVMDAAKGINLLLSNGGNISDYRGDPPAETLAARRPLLPMILAPTTAGTGSEAQSFALISDPATHIKTACGDRRPPGSGGLRPIWAILDPDLTWTAPPSVAAAVGMDALTHAVETAGCRVRTDASRRLSKLAWARLSRTYEASLTAPDDEAVRTEMLIGADLAGAAIEQSMLGAAHACANPLTARFDVVHGVAVGLMLPHVIRFNAAGDVNPYGDLDESPDRLAAAIERLLAAAALPRRLNDLGVLRTALPELAQQAAAQWTAGFNPRPVGPAELERIFTDAFA